MVLTYMQLHVYARMGNLEILIIKILDVTRWNVPARTIVPLIDNVTKFYINALILAPLLAVEKELVKFKIMLLHAFVLKVLSSEEINVSMCKIF